MLYLFIFTLFFMTLSFIKKYIKLFFQTWTVYSAIFFCQVQEIKKKVMFNLFYEEIFKIVARIKSILLLLSITKEVNNGKFEYNYTVSIPVRKVCFWIGNVESPLIKSHRKYSDSVAEHHDRLEKQTHNFQLLL